MKKHAKWLWLTALPLLAACHLMDQGEEPVTDDAEDLTVVVEADKSQILAQEEQLKADQSTLEQERERLAKERESVLNRISSLSKKDRKQRKELEAEQARLAKEEDKLRGKMSKVDRERAELERKKTELIESISALTAAKGGGGGVMAQRLQNVERRQKELLAAQSRNEKLLNEILAAVRGMDGGTRTVVVTNSGGGGGGGSNASKGQVARLESNIRAKMRAKGILSADLPPAARDYRSTGQKAAGTKDWGAAYDAFKQLEAIVSSIKVDHAFVQAKFRRINKAYEGKMKSLGEGKKNKVLALLDDVSDSFSDGRYDRANRKINQIHSLLE
jgi:DNA repair exonuclease SbcCD ATPase subunit